jgi:hypothetical protein
MILISRWTLFNTISEWFMVNSLFLNLNKTFYGIKVFRTHKYIIHIMMGRKRRESCRHLFRKLKILHLPSQYILYLLLFVINNRNLFKINSEIHSINSRQFNNFYQPRSNLSKKTPTLTHGTAAIWYMCAYMHTHTHTRFVELEYNLIWLHNRPIFVYLINLIHQQVS